MFIVTLVYKFKTSAKERKKEAADKLSRLQKAKSVKRKSITSVVKRVLFLKQTQTQSVPENNKSDK